VLSQGQSYRSVAAVRRSPLTSRVKPTRRSDSGTGSISTTRTVGKPQPTKASRVRVGGSQSSAYSSDSRDAVTMAATFPRSTRSSRRSNGPINVRPRDTIASPGLIWINNVGLVADNVGPEHVPESIIVGQKGYLMARRPLN
jgi:hypothetical protein